MKLRKWQIDAKQITSRIIDSSDEKYAIVNACVGSGKTFVAADALGYAIDKYKSGKTVQLFVTPRIKLCHQQSDEIKNVLKTVYELEENRDYSLVNVDCTSKTVYNRKDGYLKGNHIIFVICDESLFGKDKKENLEFPRYRDWLKNFNKWTNEGYRFCWAIFDEAHNYEESQNYIVNDEGKSIDNFFKVMLLSGTPSAFQKDLTRNYPTAVCSCPPKVAINNKWIVKPTLNIVQGSESCWARAIFAILHREINICKNEVFIPRIMLNCKGIDEIKQLLDLPEITSRLGKEFHLITLHSNKIYTNENKIETAKPTIDGQIVTAEEAYDTLEKIDDNTAFEDNLPILVAQVQMLGEGINVNSFNACLTASNSEKTAMQQIGRIIRNYRIGDVSKVNSGHSNIYVIFNNSETLSTLLNNLEEYDLTHECYSWGDRLDISNSSGKSIDEDEICNLNKIIWDPIDVDNDIDIVLALGKNDKRVFTRFIDTFCSGKDADGNGISDIEELDQLLLELQKTGELKYFTSRSFNLEKEVKTRQAISDSKKSRKTTSSDEKSTKTEMQVSREVLFNWINTIRTTILQNRQVMRPLWKNNTEYALSRIFYNNNIASFLTTHLSNNLKSKLGR